MQRGNSRFTFHAVRWRSYFAVDEWYLRCYMHHSYFPTTCLSGASGKTTDKGTAKICKFLGDISYPVYIIHYPFMYLFYAWLWSKEPHITFSQSWAIALCVFFGSIVLAYLCLKLYDEPVRKWLSKKFLTKK